MIFSWVIGFEMIQLILIVKIGILRLRIIIKDKIHN